MVTSSTTLVLFWERPVSNRSSKLLYDFVLPPESESYFYFSLSLVSMTYVQSRNVQSCSEFYILASTATSHLRKGIFLRLRDLTQRANELALALGVVFSPFPWRGDSFSSPSASYSIDQVSQHLFEMRENRFRSVVDNLNGAHFPASGMRCMPGSGSPSSRL